jgi:hypothetical protein
VHDEPTALFDHSAVPWVDSNQFEAELRNRSGSLTPEQRTAASELHEHGFTLLRGMVPPELCDQVREEVEPMFADDYAQKERRVPDAWRRQAHSVRDVATLRGIQDLLGAVYGRRPIPFQTLNFKWGSQQGYHSDSIHFTSIPDRFMCGVWVALEAVNSRNGPLTYYPGSHRVPQFRSFEPGDSAGRYAQFEAMQIGVMERMGVAPVDLEADKGDALIWTSNLLHGGRPILEEGSTRWSQVTHYFFEDCIYFQPIYSNFLTGEIKLLEVIDLNTLDAVEHRYDALRVTADLLPDGRRQLGLFDDRGTECAGSVGRIQRLESELAAARAECDELRRSTSFRLGQSVVAPLSRIRGRLKQ